MRAGEPAEGAGRPFQALIPLEPVAAWLALPGKLLNAESDRWFLWSPVFMALGVGAYFSLSFEPPLWLSGLLLTSLVIGLWLLRNRGPSAIVLTALLLVTLGFSSAGLRSWLVSAPVLQQAQSGWLVASVIDVQHTDQGSLSLIMAPVSFARLTPEQLPARIRLTMRQKDVALLPGQIISLRARLMPPPEPVEAGGFDYARLVWFERIGAVGFSYTAPLETSEPPLSFDIGLARLRNTITARIRQGVEGPAGPVAVALITGQKRAIPEETAQDLRNAGLAHVLSISGFHMVLFGGSVFWILRALMALVPGLALRHPIKKWAAVIAIFGATFYLLISGAGIATQRAWIMITLMFIAILLDRPALSLRNVALAAIVILLWRPESLLGASFQMSFAAVVALIAFYESDLARTISGRLYEMQGWQRWLAMPFVYLAGIAMTSLVAGAATSPFAAWNFNRIALIYGLAGNIAAMPLVALIVMPSALLALLLMPFGWEAPALWLMGQGINLMLAVAHYVSGWEGADDLIPSVSLAPLLLVVAGGLWLALWRRSWRFLGVVPLLTGLASWAPGTRPDVMIDRDGAIAAVRMVDGRLALTTRRSSYTTRQWLTHEGDSRTPGEAGRNAAMQCDRQGCLYRETAQPEIAIPRNLPAVFEDCETAQIIIAQVPVPPAIRQGCRADIVIDRFDLMREGATSLYFMPDGSVKKYTARDARGRRPWVR